MFMIEERRTHGPKRARRHTWLAATLAETVELVEDLAAGDPALAGAVRAKATQFEGTLAGRTVVLSWGPVL